MSFEESYQRWLDERRGERPSSAFANRVMESIERDGDSRLRLSLPSMVRWIDRSRSRQLAACVAALVIGSSPFVYLAYVSQTVVF